MRLIFAGTPPFAATALAALIEAKHDIALVLTQPDRPAGRGMKLQGSAVAQLAEQHGLRVEKFSTLKTAEHQAAIHAVGAQMMVVAAYGLLLPQAVLDVPALGCVNIHGSLLPRWRGAAPVQRAIEAGDNETGVGIMQMEAGLDTGPVLLEKRVSITSHHTSSSLMADLAEVGAKAMVEAIANWQSLTPRVQEHAQATYAKKIEKHEASIGWSDTAAQIERRIRAFDPFPGSQATWLARDGTLSAKVWHAQTSSSAESAAPGSIVSISPDGVIVACGSGGNERLRLTTMQIPGGRRQDAAKVAQQLQLTAGIRAAA